MSSWPSNAHLTNITQNYRITHKIMIYTFTQYYAIKLIVRILSRKTHTKSKPESTEREEASDNELEVNCDSSLDESSIEDQEESPALKLSLMSILVTTLPFGSSPDIASAGQIRVSQKAQIAHK